MGGVNLKLRLQPKQAKLYRLMESSPATWIGYGGSRGGGKSAGARRVMLLRRLSHDGTVGAIIRRTYPELLDNHISAMWREFPEIEQYYNKGEKTLTLPNGSQIVFRYAENAAAIDSFLGKEYMDIYVDQAEAFTGDELTRLRTSCRWTMPEYEPRAQALLDSAAAKLDSCKRRVDDAQCKFILGFNPGGKGTDFLKRIFHDGPKDHSKYEPGEDPTDYAFIQAYGWDNIEWVRPWLKQQKISQSTYYQQWSEQQRQDCYLTQSAYGRVMAALPPGLRAGWLYGDFDSFAGQYFDNFRPERGGRHVKRYEELGIEPWHERWISIDWGFAHNTAVYWYAKTPTHTAVYDELVVRRTDEADLARMIAEKTAGHSGERPGRCYLSPDAAAKKGSAKPTKEQIGTVLEKYGLPYPTDADNARVSGWRLVYSMLGREGEQPQLLIADHCTRLIQCLPTMSRDPKKPEDCEKFDSNDEGKGGDDPADSLRYGLKTYFGDAEPPKAVQFERRLEAVAERVGAEVSNTARHLMALKFEQEWKRSHAPLRRPLRRRH